MPLTLMKGNTMPDSAEVKEKEVQEDVTEDDKQLVDSVQAKLDALAGNTSDDTEDDTDDGDDDQTDDDKVDDDSTPEDKADDSDDDDDSTSDEDSDDKDKDKTGDTDGSESKDTAGTEEEVTLPDAFYRAAVHQGWTPDDIKDFFEASPEQALKTFAKIHESTNKLSSQFAKLGRIKPTKTADKVDADNSKSSSDDGIIDALKEQYGDDSAVVKAFTTMQTKLDTATMQKEVEEPEEGELDPAIQKRVNSFFTDSSMKPYIDFYGEGNDAAKLTIKQSETRYKLLELADSIVLGSQQQGREITVEEALESAHLLLSEPMREEAMRTELKAKIVKRAKGVTLKPKKSKAASPAKDAKLDEKQLVAKVGAKLKQTFH